MERDTSGFYLIITTSDEALSLPFWALMVYPITLENPKEYIY
jgi:hypothetical protein